MAKKFEDICGACRADEWTGVVHFSCGKTLTNYEDFRWFSEDVWYSETGTHGGSGENVFVPRVFDEFLLCSPCKKAFFKHVTYWLDQVRLRCRNSSTIRASDADAGAGTAAAGAGASASAEAQNPPCACCASTDPGDDVCFSHPEILEDLLDSAKTVEVVTVRRGRVVRNDPETDAAAAAAPVASGYRISPRGSPTVRTIATLRMCTKHVVPFERGLRDWLELMRSV